MKTLKTFAFAALAVLIGIGSAHAAGNYGDPCTLINGLGGVFKTLRLLCFAGAAFVLLGYGWTYISKGWGDKSMEDAKKQGVGMLVGFTLLFGIGLVLQFLPGMAGCNVGAFGY